MALIDDVKVNLRIKSAAFDSAEIQPIIDACKTDLKLSGVNKVEESDPLTQRAVVLYVKASFGFSADSERYQKAYDMLKNSMALSGDYNTEVTTIV